MHPITSKCQNINEVGVVAIALLFPLLLLPLSDTAGASTLSSPIAAMLGVIHIVEIVVILRAFHNLNELFIRSMGMMVPAIIGDTAATLFLIASATPPSPEHGGCGMIAILLFVVPMVSFAAHVTFGVVMVVISWTYQKVKSKVALA